MDMFDELFGGLSDLMGEDFGSASAEKPKKAAAKKEKTKETAKKTVEKAPIKLNLPLKIAGRGFLTSIDGTGEISSEEIMKKLSENGVLEASSKHFGLVGEGQLAVLCLKDEASLGLSDKVELPLTIAMGNLKMELDSTMFPDTTAVTTGDCYSKWISMYPHYATEDVKFIYDKGAGLLYPVVKEDRAFTFPLIAGIDSSFDTSAPFNITGIDMLTPLSVTSDTLKTAKPAAKQLIELVYTGFSDVKGIKWMFTKTEYEGCAYYDIIPFASDSASGKGGKSSSVKSIAKKVKYGALPLTIWFNTRPPMQVTAENFNGKDKVSEDDVKNYVCENIHGFTKENTRITYQGEIDCGEEMGVVRVMNCDLTSGKKG